MQSRALFALLVSLSLASPALAQGADVCAMAQPIAGTGTFAFDNTAATTDGVPDPLCNFFGQPDITLDVWFAWMPTSTATHTISTCSQTTLDSKIAVLQGACNGPVLACNDDACALQTSLDVDVVAGNLYYLRVGRFPGSTVGGTGTFTIVAQVPPAVVDTRVNPANGRTYHLLSTGSWTASEQAAIALGGHLTTIDDQAEHDWIAAQWHNVQGVDLHLWIGLTDVAIEGTYVWSDGTPLGFTNWAPGEPNNSNNEDYGSMRKNDALAQWNDLINVPVAYHANPQGVVEIGTTGTPFCFGDGTGTPCPCANSGAAGNGCASSVNAAGGNLAVTGNPSLSADSLVLGGSGLTDTNCLYFQGTAQQAGGLGVVFGDGLRCAGGTIVRLKTILNVAGASQYPQAGDPPVSVRGLVLAPGTRTYQVWYRNAAPFCTPDTFNLTNGVEVAWVL